MVLKRKQQLFLDGVEESFKFIRLAYSRLVTGLAGDSPDVHDSDRMDAAVLDCWVIIDLAKRLRTLLENTPGLKVTPALTLFLNRAENATDFRHYIQHLEERMHNVAATGLPIWGSVSWVHLQPENKVHICTYIPGRLANGKGIPVVNPVGRKFHADVDHIELSIDQTVINISELVRAVEQFADSFTAAVSAAENADQRDDKGLIRFQISEPSLPANDSENMVSAPPPSNKA